MSLKHLFAAALAAVAVPAVAEPVVHDSASEFARYAQGATAGKDAAGNPLIRTGINTNAAGGSFRGTQGKQLNGSSLPSNRSDVDNLFGADSLFYSLGLSDRTLNPLEDEITIATAGTLSLTIDPSKHRHIKSGALIEITYTGADKHGEAAWIFLGTEEDPFQKIAGVIWNEDMAGGIAGAWSYDVTGVKLTATQQASGDGGVFGIDILSGYFNTISFLDASRSLFFPVPGIVPANVSSSADGFDIDRLAVTSEVPEPGALGLLGLGVLALAAARRKRG